MTVRELTLRMSYRELNRWDRYRRTVGFPSHRTHLQLALIARTIVQVSGISESTGATLEEFLVRFAGSEDEAKAAPDKGAVKSGKVAAEAFANLAGGKVRVLGQRRKKGAV